ncbi:hypothetical protein Dimus_005307 [Dionaea muscipula]
MYNVIRLVWYVDRIANAKWEVKELGMEHNEFVPRLLKRSNSLSFDSYVDLLLGESKHHITRLVHGDIHEEDPSYSAHMFLKFIQSESTELHCILEILHWEVANNKIFWLTSGVETINLMDRRIVVHEVLWWGFTCELLQRKSALAQADSSAVAKPCLGRSYPSKSPLCTAKEPSGRSVICPAMEPLGRSVLCPTKEPPGRSVIHLAMELSGKSVLYTAMEQPGRSVLCSAMESWGRSVLCPAS